MGGQADHGHVIPQLLMQSDRPAAAPDKILAEVASLLQEVELRVGETIFNRGDPGDCMYIIVSGKVRVHDGDHTFNHLEQGDVFGEMAVLDSGPRSATAIAEAEAAEEIAEEKIAGAASEEEVAEAVAELEAAEATADVEIAEALSSPATLSVDTAANTGFPGCGDPCGFITPDLQVDPTSLNGPGQVVELSAADTTADKCADVLQGPAE